MIYKVMGRAPFHLFTQLCCVLLVVTSLTLSACQQPRPVTNPILTHATTPTTTRATGIPMQQGADPPPANKLGVHLLLDDGRHQWPIERWSEHMHYGRQAVGAGGYVTQLVRADDLSVKRWQTFMDLCAELQLTPITRLATTFDHEAGWWRAPTADADGRYRDTAARYATFLAALRWPTDRHYVIVGNEPNRGDEWSGRRDPAAYARFLLDVADMLSERDRDVLILNAGLDLFAPHTGSAPAFDGKYYMDAETFLDQMHAAHPDVFGTIDLWSSHSYPLGPFAAPPWQQTFAVEVLNDANNPVHVEPPPDIPNRGINGYRWKLFKLSTYDVPVLPVMITDTGWRHAEAIDPMAKDAGDALPDAETASRFLDLALRGNHARYPEFPEAGRTPWLADARVDCSPRCASEGAKRLGSYRWPPRYPGSHREAKHRYGEP